MGNVPATCCTSTDDSTIEIIRRRSHTYTWKPNSAGESPYLVRPFHLNITVLNKEEVIERKVGSWFGGVAGFVVSDDHFVKVVATKLIKRLPEKAYEKAGIQFELQHVENESHGNVFVMTVQLTGFDMEELGAKGMGLDRRSAEKFKEAYDTLLPALRKMGMADKAEQVETSIYEKIRWKAMTKLNASLAAELAKEPNFLKVSLEVPELQTEEPPNQSPDMASPDMLGMARSEPFLLQAKVSNKTLLLEENLENRNHNILKNVVPKVGNLVPDVLIDKVIERKLESQIPAMLAERAGIVAQCKRLKRRSPNRKGNELQEESVVVEVAILEYTEFPPVKLLTASKGSEFTAAFKELWEGLCKLEQLGVPGISCKMKEIGDRIAPQVRVGVTKKLQEALQERLHAVVRIWEENPDEDLRFHPTPSE